MSIFLATIVGIITQPLFLIAVELMGLGRCILTKTQTIAAFFSALGNPTPWLIAFAFVFSYRFLSISARAGWTEHKLGSWLMLTCFQTSVISYAMFLMAMAPNPLSVTFTFNTIKQTTGWTDWAKAAIVPGLASVIAVVLLLYVIFPPRGGPVGEE